MRVGVWVWRLTPGAYGPKPDLLEKEIRPNRDVLVPLVAVLMYGRSNVAWPDLVGLLMSLLNVSDPARKDGAGGGGFGVWQDDISPTEPAGRSGGLAALTKPYRREIDVFTSSTFWANADLTKRSTLKAGCGSGAAGLRPTPHLIR